MNDTHHHANESIEYIKFLLTTFEVLRCVFAVIVGLTDSLTVIAALGIQLRQLSIRCCPSEARNQ